MKRMPLGEGKLFCRPARKIYLACQQKRSLDFGKTRVTNNPSLTLKKYYNHGIESKKTGCLHHVGAPLHLSVILSI
jgi:hypothetical protein